MLFSFFGSINGMLNFQLGPIVDFKYPSTKYFPFMLIGFFSFKIIIKDFKFFNNYSSLNVIFPKGAWRFLPLSTLNVTCPDLASLIAGARPYFFAKRVPTFGLGINPLGPSNLPYCLIFGNKSWVVNSI